MESGRTIHTTVLKAEAIKYLDVKSNGFFVDLTLGGGGHSLEILKTLEEGKLIAFDLSLDAINRVSEVFKESYSFVEINKEAKEREVEIYLVNRNFARLKETLEELGINNNSIEGILADLGWSSDQLGDIPGLSYKNLKDELDMRFDRDSTVKAKDLLNALGRKELKLMFSRYADIWGRQSNRLVDGILTTRKARAIEKVKDLTELITENFPVLERENKSFGFYSKVFQALRIAVNNEYANLNEMLKSAREYLKDNGNLVVITFHSGEEKVLNEFIKQNIKGLHILSRSSEGNYIRPSVDEINENVRARSAKLYAVKKI